MPAGGATRHSCSCSAARTYRRGEQPLRPRLVDDAVTAARFKLANLVHMNERVATGRMDEPIDDVPKVALGAVEVRSVDRLGGVEVDETLDRPGAAQLVLDGATV